MFVRQGCWNQLKVVLFFSVLWLQYSLKSPTFQALKEVVPHPTFLSLRSQPTPQPPEPRGVGVRSFSWCFGAYNFGWNVDRLYGQWWIHFGITVPRSMLVVGGCVGFVGLLNNVDYRELEFVFVVWMDLLFLFWSLLFFVLMLFCGNLSHIVGHEFLCVFFWSMPATQKHLNAQL